MILSPLLVTLWCLRLQSFFDSISTFEEGFLSSTKQPILPFSPKYILVKNHIFIHIIPKSVIKKARTSIRRGRAPVGSGSPGRTSSRATIGRPTSSGAKVGVSRAENGANLTTLWNQRKIMKLPWNYREITMKLPWNIMKYHEISGNIMKYQEISGKKYDKLGWTSIQTSLNRYTWNTNQPFSTAYFTSLEWRGP